MNVLEDYVNLARNIGLPFRPSSMRVLGLIMGDYKRRDEAQALASKLMSYIEDASDHISEGLYLSLSDTLSSLCKTRVLFPPDDSEEVALLQDSIGILEDEYRELEIRYHRVSERYMKLLEDSLRMARVRTGLISGLISVLETDGS